MTECPTDGVCASSALAFSTLLSSQGAGAHCLGARAPSRATIQHYQARHLSSTSSGELRWLGSRALPPGRPPPSACAHAQALARRTSWWLPRGPDRFRVHPRRARRTLGVPRAFVKSTSATFCYRRSNTALQAIGHPPAVLPARNGGLRTRPRTRTAATGFSGHPAKHRGRPAYFRPVAGTG